jgi:hypothetical protein
LEAAWPPWQDRYCPLSVIKHGNLSALGGAVVRFDFLGAADFGRILNVSLSIP